MGFYFRKSYTLGGVRVNFSKSGVGFSSGIKGFRISTGPRGTYANIGRNGFYYRERLDKATQSTKQQPRATTPPVDTGNSDKFETNFEQLVDSSHSEMISKINRRMSKVGLTSFIVVAVIVVWLILAGMGNILAVLLFSLVSIGFILIARKLDQKRRLTPLFYELDVVQTSRFTSMQQACQFLSQCCKIWSVDAQQSTSDWKRNAGAANLVARHSVTVDCNPPLHISTNLSIWCINVSKQLKLYFFPDTLFVYSNGKYAVVPYSSLNVEYSTVNFLETEGVPSDSKGMGYTWQYVNKDGGPDRRYSNNRQIPIVMYSELMLHSNAGLKTRLMVSNIVYARRFADFFTPYHSQTQRPGTGQTNDNRGSSSKETRQSQPNHSSAYDILGVNANATMEEITSAYIHLAQMYHPDKVAGLGLELRELAEKKMKEINVAYDTLKKTS